MLEFYLPALFNAYGIFLFRQFYMSFPADLEEAAKLDGCSTYRMFLQSYISAFTTNYYPTEYCFFFPGELEQLPVAVDCK